MSSTERPITQASWPGASFAYVMTGIAIACLVVSGVLGSIFSPDFVSTSGTATGYVRQHAHVAAYSGWIWNVIALAMLLTAAMRGIRAEVSERAAWTLLGLGVGGTWLAVMFVSIFAPVMVTGTAPWLTWVPLGSILAVIAGLVVTWLLCHFVKVTFFQAAPTEPRAIETVPYTVKPSAASEMDAATKLRQLAQLRDSGVISEADFQSKKDELLSRM